MNGICSAKAWAKRAVDESVRADHAEEQARKWKEACLAERKRVDEYELFVSGITERLKSMDAEVQRIHDDARRRLAEEIGVKP